MVCPFSTWSNLICKVIPTSSESLCKTHKIRQPGGKEAKITNPERGVEVCSCHCRQVGPPWQVEWLGGGDQNACMRSVSRVSLFRAKITRWARPASSLAPCHRLPLFAPTIHVARPLCLFDCLLLCLFVFFFVWLFGCLYQQTEILKRRQTILFLLVRGAQEIFRNWAYWLTLGLISEAVPGVL